ncbi:MAG: glycosyltransferase family 1 protein, partial [Clostridia bacterium]|nr:glycosyltransferase family 1 protein [Clostridia bacterium]
LKNSENGYTYHKSFEQLYQQVKYLLDHPEEVARVGKNAYYTITDEWSAAVAADRLIALCNKLLKGEKQYFASGPCSKAKVFLKKERA